MQPASAGPLKTPVQFRGVCQNLDPTMTFSLLHEPWIPLIATDGNRRLGSLLEALLDPDRWRGVDGANPIETLSLYRLMLAICHRAIGPARDPRVELLDSWPRASLQRYLKNWAGSFDLLHPQTPFLQVPALAKGGIKPSPWTRLALERTSGAARLIWDHSIDERPTAIGFAEAARQLVAHLQFTPGGLVKALRTSAVRGPACGLLLMLPMGATLKETLALGLIQQTKSQFEADLPCWERPALTLEELRQPEALVLEGPAHRYTFLSRAVLLLPEGNHLSQLLYAEGLVTGESENPLVDPMTGVIQGRRGSLPLLLSEQKSFWRDFHVLQGAGGSTAPATVNHAAALRLQQRDHPPIDLLAGGLLPDQARIVLWRLEERQVPPEVLQSKALIACTTKALELAEQTGSAFNKAAYALCSSWLQRTAESSPDARDVRALLTSIQAAPMFWAGLDPSFWTFIQTLGTTRDPELSLQEWRIALRETTRDAWKHATAAFGTDSRAIAAAGRTDHLTSRILATLKC
jgi:CRISPR system Cascade subunit CasA